MTFQLNFFFDVKLAIVTEPSITKCDRDIQRVDNRHQAPTAGRSDPCGQMTGNFYDVSCPSSFKDTVNLVIKNDCALLDQFVQHREIGRLLIDDNLARASFQFVYLYQHDNSPLVKSGKPPV